MDVQILLAVVGVVASAGIAWGISQAKLRALEIRLAITESERKTDHDIVMKEQALDVRVTHVEAEHRSDHDLLIRLDEKVNLILQKLDNMDNRITRLEARQA
jgi:enoyl-[acyl-carrier-protein] reductase (NADH)